MCDGITDRSWICDMHGSLGLAATIEYFGLWSRIQQIELSDVPDKISWNLTQNEQYTNGSTITLNWRPIW